MKEKEIMLGVPEHDMEGVELDEHRAMIYLPENASSDLADYAVSVSEIARRTGQSFFPDIPAEVKSQCRPSDWGL